MDGFVILLIIIGVVVVIAIASGSFSLSKLFMSKGEYGEKRVSDFLGENIPGQKYVFNDYYIKDGNKTSQIDHILINNCGVFVIETKNYSGMIYGREEQQNWTQVLNYGKVKNRFYNPIKQNEGHIYRIRKILGDVPIHSLIVFIHADISNVYSKIVVNLKDINSALMNQQQSLSSKQIDIIYNKLLTARANDEVTKEEHIENIHKMKDNIEQGICPRCGGKLVLRHGKYGDFYGCENYPECKFIKK